MGEGMMKVLNLYCGIGGNVAHWPAEWEVVAVDNHPDVVKQYRTYFPHHTVIEGDAHAYLLEHFRDFDLIWSSPPCPSHSRMQKGTRHTRRVYPDMTLYQEVIFLQHFFAGSYVVENVKPYYEPLIKPNFTFGRHVFWSNLLPDFDYEPPHFTMNGKTAINSGNAEGRKAMLEWLGLPPMEKNIYFKGSNCPGKVIRNCVHPELAHHIIKELIE
jgi:DNA (cytosine-5)-methyltransferase 1